MLLRRLFGGDEPRDGSAAIDEADPDPGPIDPIRFQAPPPAPNAICPTCGFALDPPPVRDRLCPSCRQPIVVRRADGRIVLLAESAVSIFDRERQRATDEAAWTSGREGWLKLAAYVRAPVERRDRIAAAPLSASVVDDARDLYLSNAERAVRAARTAKRWPEVARIRRQQATALFREAGEPVPPPDEVVALQREGMLAHLRALAETSGYAELASTGCCRACAADDGSTFPIAAELRAPRLPHAGCPKGLCGCEWWIATPPKKKGRAKRRRPVPVMASDVIDGPSSAASEDPIDGDIEHRSISNTPF
jgi:hypothetical protein